MRAIDREPELRRDAGRERRDKERHRSTLQPAPAAPEEQGSDGEHRAGHVLTADLEGGKALCGEGDREDLPPVHGGQREAVHHQVRSQHRQHADAAPHDKGRRHKRGCLQKRQRHPDLSRRIDRRTDDAHTREVRRVHNMQDRHCEQHDAKKHGEVVLQKLPQHPGHQEDRHGDDREEDLGQQVEEVVGDEEREREQPDGDQRHDHGGLAGRKSSAGSRRAISHVGHGTIAARARQARVRRAAPRRCLRPVKRLSVRRRPPIWTRRSRAAGACHRPGPAWSPSPGCLPIPSWSAGRPGNRPPPAPRSPRPRRGR